MEKITGLIRYLLGREQLPKSFRQFLKAHGAEVITKLEITRTPIDNVAKGLLNVLTLGKWDEIKKKAEVDKLFHTALRINDKYYLEKTAIPNLKVGSPVITDETESLVIPVGRKAYTIAGLVEAGMKELGEDYYTYDGFKNNCQNFIAGHLRGVGLLSEGIQSFLKQDIKRLIEETPSFSQWLGRKITDIAGYGEGASEELRYRRGGAFALGGRYDAWFQSLLPADRARLEKIAADRGVPLDREIYERFTSKRPFARGGCVSSARKKFLM